MIHAAVLVPGEPYKLVTTYASMDAAFGPNPARYAYAGEGPPPRPRGQWARDVVSGVAMAIVVGLVILLACKGWLAGPLIPLP